jgi:NAD(P)-dependent dehydrogenase (short-subunit alcohol dehydrogenase family)
MKKVALITGGTRGIGLGIAQNLGMKGFNLALNGVREINQVIPVLEELKRIGIEVIYCQGNIGDMSTRRRIIDEIRERYKRLDVLVNNAGIAPKDRKDIMETTESSYDEVMNVNLKGPYFLTQLVSDWMIRQKEMDADYEGCIINITSISSTVASINRGEYCISKAGLSMMTQLFAVRLGDYNIPVFEVRPGITETDMTSGVKNKYDNLIAKGLCLQKRWGTPDDVGKAVASLASGDFAYSTGQVIMIDGGLTISRL